MRVLQNKRTYKCHCQENRIVHNSSIAFIMAPKSGLSKFKPTIETRTRNKMIHPGQVVNDAKQKRTSHEEMEKICAEETRMQYEKELDQVESIQKAADIEDRMRREDINHLSSAYYTGLLDLNLKITRQLTDHCTKNQRIQRPQIQLI